MTVQKRRTYFLFLPPRHLFSQAWISCSEMKDEEWSATVDCVFVLSESRTWTLTPDLSSASSVASQCQCIKHSKFSKLSVQVTLVCATSYIGGNDRSLALWPLSATFLWFMDVNVSSIHHLNYPHWTSHYLTSNQVCFKIVHCSWKVFTLSNHLLMVLKTTLGNKSVFPNQSEGWSVWKGLQMYIVINKTKKQKQKVRGL